MLRADLHVHTKHSFDCSTSFEEIIERCGLRGITCVAIADHATAEGALKLREIAPFRVIVAEEVLTPWGEVMGMFLKESIPSPLSVQETLARIRDQEGLVCIPHPFDTLRGTSAFRDDRLEEVLPLVNVIEVFNSRSLMPGANARARRLAREHGIAGSAGSDAHTPAEIGNSYVEISDFDGPQQFLKALAAGKIVGRRSNPAVHFSSTWSKITKRSGKEPGPTEHRQEG